MRPCLSYCINPPCTRLFTCEGDPLTWARRGAAEGRRGTVSGAGPTHVSMWPLRRWPSGVMSIARPMACTLGVRGAAWGL